ncbi:MAG: glycosyltransferase [Elusimicrobia bacterium]|nr:glycosyltransferase [Elusimicrobiota bacterium]
MKFSVVIAAVNEGVQIASSLKRLRQVSTSSALEIIVVDGGSDDGTAKLAAPWADQVVSQEKPNRGLQLDAGAKIATGDLLFFLRADSQPPENWQQALEHFWLSPHPRKVAATAFRVDYGSRRTLRWAAKLANAWAEARGLFSSEHGLCLTPEVYRASGGYPPLAFQEDHAFCKCLKKHGKMVLLKECLHPAARRLRRLGPLNSAASQAWLKLRYKLGASPESLWRSYNGL